MTTFSPRTREEKRKWNRVACPEIAVVHINGPRGGKKPKAEGEIVKGRKEGSTRILGCPPVSLAVVGVAAEG